MKEIKREGRSEYEVVTDFRKEYKIDQVDKLEYEIIEKGSNGFFSLFGTRPTVIKFFLPGDGSEGVSGVADYIEGILKLMGVKYTDVQVKTSGRETRIKITGVRDKGYLIGREGRLLNSLQHLTHRMLLQQKAENPKVVIDVDNYRTKQRDSFQSRIEKISKNVLDSGRSFTLDSMNPAERRTVHQYIETQSKLKTTTIGDGQNKRVVIMLESEKAPPANANRSRRGRRGGRSRNKQQS
ncbi:MAG: Jag N-terminal domain-containing protein [Candidatus Cloacimonetes bacterium]|nr:Jag N-terminal domain-containing protein [Candidatus Cloacimonadota bacterium]